MFDQLIIANKIVASFFFNIEMEQSACCIEEFFPIWVYPLVHMGPNPLNQIFKK